MARRGQCKEPLTCCDRDLHATAEGATLPASVAWESLTLGLPGKNHHDMGQPCLQHCQLQVQRITQVGSMLLPARTACLPVWLLWGHSTGTTHSSQARQLTWGCSALAALRAPAGSTDIEMDNCLGVPWRQCLCAALHASLWVADPLARSAGQLDFRCTRHPARFRLGLHSATTVTPKTNLCRQSEAGPASLHGPLLQHGAPRLTAGATSSHSLLLLYAFSSSH